MLEAIAVGDLHLTDDKGRGGLAKYIPEPNAFVCRELQKACDWATAKDIRHVFLPGDLCDGHRMSYEAMVALTNTIDANAGLRFWVIPGNHDMTAADPAEPHSLQVLQLLGRKNLQIIMRPTLVTIAKQRVWFMPHPCQTFKKDALNIAHVEVKGAQSDSGQSFDSDELSTSKAHALIGHLHTEQRVRNSHYMGTLYQTNFGEKAEKYFAHVQYDGDECEVSMVRHKPEYELRTIVLTSRQDLRQIPDNEKVLVKLVVQDGVDVTAHDWRDNPNVVTHKAFKTREELAAVLTEDLSEGTNLIIRTEEFFNEWIQAADIEPALVRRMQKVRKRLLTNLRA